VTVTQATVSHTGDGDTIETGVFI